MGAKCITNSNSKVGSDLGDADDRVKKFYGIIPKAATATGGPDEDSAKTGTNKSKLNRLWLGG